MEQRAAGPGSKLSMPDHALALLSSADLSESKAQHSRIVASAAERIAARMRSAGLRIEPNLAYVAGLIHDLGLEGTRYRTTYDEEQTPWPEHAVVGAGIAMRHGFSRAVARTIQGHEGVGYTRAEIAYLHLPPPALGATWRSDSLLTKVVCCADQLADVVGEKGLDPWKDVSVIVLANYEYYNVLYQARAGRSLTTHDRVLRRIVDRTSAILPFADRDDVAYAEPHSQALVGDG
jgi:putative nucleotidyltransferase with HDIG domain